MLPEPQWDSLADFKTGRVYDDQLSIKYFIKGLVKNSFNEKSKRSLKVQKLNKFYL